MFKIFQIVIVLFLEQSCVFGDVNGKIRNLFSRYLFYNKESDLAIDALLHCIAVTLNIQIFLQLFATLPLTSATSK